MLVHCFRGKSRSATAVVQYLMQVEQLTLKEAMDATKQARPSIDINVGFRQALMDLEQALRPGAPPSVVLSLKSRRPALSSASRQLTPRALERRKSLDQSASERSLAAPVAIPVAEYSHDIPMYETAGCRAEIPPK